MSSVAKAEPATPLLEVSGLTRILPAVVPVTLVQDVSFDVGDSEFVAITGPSGSGKSSLLYLLGLLDRPTEGEVRIGPTATRVIRIGSSRRQTRTEGSTKAARATRRAAKAAGPPRTARTTSTVEGFVHVVRDQVKSAVTIEKQAVVTCPSPITVAVNQCDVEC